MVKLSFEQAVERMGWNIDRGAKVQFADSMSFHDSGKNSVQLVDYPDGNYAIHWDGFSMTLSKNYSYGFIESEFCEEFPIVVEYVNDDGSHCKLNGCGLCFILPMD